MHAIFTANYYHPHWVLGKIGYIHTYIPSLKLTWHLKMVVSNGNFLFQGAPIFRCENVSFRGFVSFRSISFAPNINWSTIEVDHHFQLSNFCWKGPLSRGTSHIAFSLGLIFPIPSMGRTVYLPTWMVYFYGFHVAKYTSPMDAMGLATTWRIQLLGVQLFLTCLTISVL